MIRQLGAHFARLGIGSSPAENDAIVGNPPWLYSAEHMLDVARTLPDGAGAAALGEALRTWRRSQSPD